MIAYALDESLAMVEDIADRRAMDGQEDDPETARQKADADAAFDDTDWTPPPPPEWMTEGAA